MIDRLIMFPGMGADGRLFGPQVAAGLPVEVPPMVMPRRGDDLPSYARRVRDTLDLRGDYAIGGVSFGGMLACEVVQICRPKCLILVAACRGGASIPRFYHVAEIISRLLPSPIVHRRCVASSRIMARIEHLSDAQYELIRDMSVDLPVPYLRRIGRMIVNWKGPGSFPCPVFHIHGGSDKVIPPCRVEPDEIVSGGGHLINLTHAEQVNAFIARHMNSHG